MAFNIHEGSAVDSLRGIQAYLVIGFAQQGREVVVELEDVQRD